MFAIASPWLPRNFLSIGDPMVTNGCKSAMSPGLTTGQPSPAQTGLAACQSQFWAPECTRDSKGLNGAEKIFVHESDISLLFLERCHYKSSAASTSGNIGCDISTMQHWCPFKGQSVSPHLVKM